MSNLPDFSPHNYQIERELGHNRAGGRVTYLAKKILLEPPLYLGGEQTLTHPDQKREQEVISVVIKQFQFAQSGASWAEYDAYEREIKVLRSLHHPGIPGYLDSFETPTGFCLVQEYKDAPSLATYRRFLPEEIKEIAVCILEILIDLQSQIPPVIHRDIKPENILVTSDEKQQIKAYLVDFGFARVGSGEVAVSSVVKGTLGFMPPEQLFNRQLTEASDLYGLGATLICLLTNTSSAEIGNLMDADYRLNFQHLLQHLNPRFLDWLQKMVAPNLKERYANAADALKALKPIDLNAHERKHRLPNKKRLLTVISICLLISSGYWFNYFFSKDNDSSEIVAENINKPKIKYKHSAQFSTSLNKDYQPVDEVKQISVNQKQVYFYVKFDYLPSNQYDGSCRISDGSYNLKYEGNSVLIAENNKFETWCVYDFNPEVDKPGEWKFAFYLDDQEVASKTLTVLPK